MGDIFKSEYLEKLQDIVGHTNGVYHDTDSFLPLIRGALADLQEYRARWEKAARYSPIGIAIVSSEGHWLEVNPAVCHILDRKETELLTLRWQDVTHPEDIEPDQALVDSIKSEELITYNFKKRYIQPSGAIKNVLLSMSKIIHENESVYFIKQIIDLDWCSEILRLDRLVTVKVNENGR